MTSGTTADRRRDDLRGSDVAPVIGYDALGARIVVARRLGGWVVGIGIATTQTAAHLGAFEVSNLRLFELLGLLAIGWTLLFWCVPWERYSRDVLAFMSTSSTGLILLTVLLTGGSDSPAWVYYLLLAFFNSLYFRPRVAVAILPLLVALSALPAVVQGDDAALRVQLVIVAPVFLMITLIGTALVPELRATGEARFRAAVAQQRYDEATRWSRRLEAIHEVARRSNRLLDVAAICETIIAQTRRVVDHDECRIDLLDGGALVPVAAATAGVGSAPDTRRTRLADPVVGWVAQHREAILVADTTTDRRIGEAGTGQPVASVLAVPLLHEGEVLGVLALTARGAARFAASDLMLMGILAAQAANAIANARLHAATRLLADTDPLTGLLNHRVAHERLAALLDGVDTGDAAGEPPLSVVMLDVNAFKQVNDVHGHQTGDEVLRRVADVLRSVCRPADLIARYGGDEFMLILPETGRTAAIDVARRIASVATATDVRTRDGILVPLRVAVGTATFPDDGATAAELAAVADARLYEDKPTPRHAVEQARERPASAGKMESAAD